MVVNQCKPEILIEMWSHLKVCIFDLFPPQCSFLNIVLASLMSWSKKCNRGFLKIVSSIVCTPKQPVVQWQGGGDVTVAMETHALPWRAWCNVTAWLRWCHMSPWQPITATAQMFV